MEFSYSEEQEQLRELAAQILGDRATHERLKQFEARGEWFDRELWSDLAGANLLGLALPEAHGGMDFGFQELCILLEESGRRTPPIPLLPTLALGALPLARFGTPEQQARWLPGVSAGETVLTAAWAEPGSGDPGRPRTRATPAGDGWKLDGEKTCVPVGNLADAIVVPARLADGGTGLFLLEPSSAGVTREDQTATHREPQVRLVLEGASAERLGGDDALDVALQHATAAVCAQILGVAEEALRQTAAYTSTRKQFGKPIGSFQGVSLRAADGYVDVECMRGVAWSAIWRLSEGRDAAREVAVAKWWACRGGQRVVHTAQHLHGGTGADVDYPIHRYFLWARGLEVLLGGGTPQLARLGRILTEAA